MSSTDPAHASSEALQEMMAAICRAYAARLEAGENFPPVAAGALTDTEAMRCASGLLAANNLAVFELGMWQSWTGH